MPSAADFQDAYVHYLGKFPTLESLGEDAAAWIAELEKITPEAFDSILATNVNLEGGSVGGLLNFRQRILIRALYAVRAKRDPDYTNPYAEAAPDAMPPRRMGSIVTFEPLP